MHWYGGSIAEAVTLSKQRNAIFVVFVEGDNELSTELASTIDDPSVLMRLSDLTNFLAIKLKSGSPNYTHFAQIYQFVPVPSLFFIGRNGTPLEVVCAGVEPANLATRIDRILQQHHTEKQPHDQSGPPSVQPSTSSQSIAEQMGCPLHPQAILACPLHPEATTAAKTAPRATTATSATTAPRATTAPSATTAPRATTAPNATTVAYSAATANPTATDAEEKNKPVRETPDKSEPAAKVQKTEHHEVTKSGQEYDVVCDGDVCVRRPKAAAADEAGPSQRPEPVDVGKQTMETESPEEAADMEEKLERAKELIEARRREKAEQEKEAERQKELERRSQGQGVAELKKWQADQELKQIQDERKREKMENDLVRQRILEQIAQDRAERRARDLPPAAPPAPPAPHTPPAAVPTSGDGSARARVQFKLPDGSSHTAHFPADGTLADVQRYIADNLQLGTSSFSLWTAFPRRELTETDATLRRLELAPSAALLVLPRRQPTQVATPSALASLMTFFTQFFTSFILEPSQQLLNWVRTRLFPTPPSGRPASPSPPRQTPPPGLRRRGNIHRLPGERANDDDNNTWNGNSTQQM